MMQDTSASTLDTGRKPVAAQARAILRRARKAALATCLADGAPYASLVTVATDPSGAPVILISKLARHTQNLMSNPRASLLLDETGVDGDPLQGARLSVMGRFSPTSDEVAQRRFLARQPDAAGYAGFADFSFWRMEISDAHYIGGFGRIFDLSADELTIPVADAGDLIAAERGIVEHMNEDHADAIELYAVKLLGGKPGPWRMTGCDPEGCDLVLDDRALRLVFPDAVTGPEETRRALVDLVKRARGG
jgi:putative heme iron utilization protein